MIPCIGLASALGGCNDDAEEGPSFFKENLKIEELYWKRVIKKEDFIFQEGANNYEKIAKLNEELAKESFLLSKNYPFFFSFGGDHSSAIGLWSGIAEEKRQKGEEFGLLWLDAHLDAHTPLTSESGNIHGMGVAHLLGEGDRRLSEILSPYPKIKPENLIIMGARSFETKEEETLRNLGVKIYWMEEILKRGFSKVLQEALKKIKKGAQSYGVSFDLDLMDDELIKATGTPVSGGLKEKDLFLGLDSLRDYFKENRPVAFEIVEYIPKLDKDLKTFNFSKRLIEFFTKLID